MSAKVRLGGMALSNGVLVHGPTAWACAIRTDEGEIKVAASRKRLFAPGIQQPFLRGPTAPGRVVRDDSRAPPQAAAGAPAVRAAVRARRHHGERRGGAGDSALDETRDAARELLSGALSLAPAILALRGGELAAYHGAEHVSIGTYEHGEKRAKEHERCGSHLIGPLLAASAVGNVLASRAPAHLRGPAGPRARSGPSASPSRCSPG